MKFVRSILSIGAVAAAAGLLLIGITSCKTTRGFGEDVRDLGQQIEGEAAEHTHY